jgi:two-component system response regulator AtoC
LSWTSQFLRAQRPSPSLAPESQAALERYAWPGNVRELKNVMDRALVLADREILLEHLPAKVADPHAGRTSSPPPLSDRASRPDGAAPEALARLRGEMEALERRRIVDALDRCGGNQTQAAEILGMSRRTLVSRLGEYDLPRPRKR